MASSIYPSAPLEAPAQLVQEQQQHLLTAPRPPPSYDQATSPAPATSAVPPPPPVNHTVVIVPATAGPQYGPSSMDVQCPFCHNYTRTRVRFRPNSRTHLIALLLCLFQLYCCVCLPYCIASCMNTNHYCGMCDHYLGSYTRH